MTNAAFPQDLSRMCIWKLKYSSKIHCQIDLLLVWSTHNSFYHHCQASTFFLLLFVASFTLPSHRSFFHSLPWSCCCYWFDNNIISYFYLWREQLSLSFCRISLMSYVWTCVSGDVSMTRWIDGIEKLNLHSEMYLTREIFLCEIVTLIFRQLSRYWVLRMKFNHSTTFHGSIHDFVKFTNDVDAYQIEPFQLNILSSHVNHFYFLFPFPFSRLLAFIAHRHKFSNAVPCDRIELIKRKIHPSTVEWCFN